MAPFPVIAALTRPDDFYLVGGGGVALYRDPGALRDQEERLAALGYEGVRLDGAGWDEARFHTDIAEGLGFPDWYGRNWAALTDCLGGVASGGYGWDPGVTGRVVSVRGFDQFALREPQFAAFVAGAFGAATRYAILFGHRIVWLLQVGDPEFRIPHVDLPWNRRER